MGLYESDHLDIPGMKGLHLFLFFMSNCSQRARLGGCCHLVEFDRQDSEVESFEIHAGRVGSLLGRGVAYEPSGQNASRLAVFTDGLAGHQCHSITVYALYQSFTASRQIE